MTIEVKESELQQIVDKAMPKFEAALSQIRKASDDKFQKALKRTNELYTEAWNFFVDENLPEKEQAALIQGYVGTALILLNNDQ